MHRIIILNKKRIFSHLLWCFFIFYFNLPLFIALSLLFRLLKDWGFLFYRWELRVNPLSLLLSTHTFPRIILIRNRLQKRRGSPFWVVIKGRTLFKLLFNWIPSYWFIKIVLCLWEICQIGICINSSLISDKRDCIKKFSIGMFSLCRNELFIVLLYCF